MWICSINSVDFRQVLHQWVQPAPRIAAELCYYRMAPDFIVRPRKMSTQEDIVADETVNAIQVNKNSESAPHTRFVCPPLAIQVC